MTSRVDSSLPPRTAWKLNRQPPEIRSDEQGEYFIVQPGNTPSTIAEELKKLGKPIPKELEAYYFSKNDPSRPDPKKHELNLPVGAKFYLPKQAEQGGQTYSGWLRGARAPAKPSANATDTAPRPSPTPIAAPNAPVAPPQAGELAASWMSTLTTHIQGLNGRGSTNEDTLTAYLAKDLRQVPAGTTGDQVRASLEAYIRSGQPYELIRFGSDADFSRLMNHLLVAAQVWAADRGMVEERRRDAYRAAIRQGVEALTPAQAGFALSIGKPRGA